MAIEPSLVLGALSGFSAWLVRRGLLDDDAELFELLAGASEGRADGVFGDADFGADFPVSLAFEVELTHDLSIGLGEVIEEESNLLHGLNGSVRDRFARRLQSGPVGFDMAPRLGFAAADDFLDDDSTGNDCQVRRERALLPKSSQHRKIVFDEPDEDLGTEVIDIIVRNPDTASVGRVADHMHKKSDEPVDKALPRPWRTRQALLEKSSIDIGQRHESPHSEHNSLC